MTVIVMMMTLLIYDISLLFYRYNPSHVVSSGDMNVDLSRTSPNSRILTDFITYVNLLPCIDLSQSNIIFISSILQENIIECSIIDNHLHSDHIAINLYLQIDMSYIEID